MKKKIHTYFSLEYGVAFSWKFIINFFIRMTAHWIVRVKSHSHFANATEG